MAFVDRGLQQLDGFGVPSVAGGGEAENDSGASGDRSIARRLGIGEQ